MNKLDLYETKLKYHTVNGNVYKTDKYKHKINYFNQINQKGGTPTSNLKTNFQLELPEIEFKNVTVIDDHNEDNCSIKLVKIQNYQNISYNLIKYNTNTNTNINININKNIKNDILNNDDSGIYEVGGYQKKSTNQTDNCDYDYERVKFLKKDKCDIASTKMSKMNAVINGSSFIPDVDVDVDAIGMEIWRDIIDYNEIYFNKEYSDKDTCQYVVNAICFINLFTHLK